MEIIEKPTNEERKIIYSELAMVKNPPPLLMF